MKIFTEEYQGLFNPANLARWEVGELTARLRVISCNRLYGPLINSCEKLWK